MIIVHLDHCLCILNSCFKTLVESRTYCSCAKWLYVRYYEYNIATSIRDVSVFVMIPLYMSTVWNIRCAWNFRWTNMLLMYYLTINDDILRGDVIGIWLLVLKRSILVNCNFIVRKSGLHIYNHLYGGQSHNKFESLWCQIGFVIEFIGNDNLNECRRLYILFEFLHY